uniref:NADH-ubiquinone oxidoreductase chain 2 n=1 Tax=Chthonerpeton indistinctum TaxID=420416 RepID=W5RGY6_CHTIN|nr:NADH dehydrogenase subunit 2 [Chthonerpeton indistinctum]AGZ18918.1 NADH dehydrogenase subunit 2 [Chthonerpeton indistinctum]
MNPLPLTIVFISLLTGTTITLTSNHWLFAWLGLEINTIAIIPLLIQHHHPRATEATMKYFLTQAAASTIILFTTLLNAKNTGEWEITTLSSTNSNMMTIALMMKLGLAPMHFWLPEVLQGVDLTTGLILSTWQKIAPLTLMIMIHTSLNPNLLMLIGLLSIIIGGWSGINQTQLRKILAFSSVAHLGWMMTILPISPELTMLNFIIYLTLTTSMFLSMKIIGTTKLSMMTISWMKTPILTVMMLLILLSLGGLPPTSGFMPKWLILQELTKQNLSMIATLMAVTALLSLFFYLRLCYSLTLTQSPNYTNSTPSWRHKTNTLLTTTTTATMLSLMLLPTTPSML